VIVRFAVFEIGTREFSESGIDGNDAEDDCGDNYSAASATVRHSTLLTL
jgi:hypothetical protein